MPIMFACPACRSRISVAEQYAGRTGKCPSCGKPVCVPIPAADDPAARARNDDELAQAQTARKAEAAPEVWSGLDRQGFSLDDEEEWRRPRRMRSQPMSPWRALSAAGGVFLGVCVVLAAFLRIASLAKRIESNRPAQPIKELSTIDGRWEDGRGYLVFTPETREIDGRQASHSFERSDGGPPERGLAVTWNSKLDLPWQKGDFLMYTLQDGAIRRREKMGWKFDASTLQTWDEKGRERVYRRKK